MKRLGIILNYAAAVMGVLVVFEYVVGVFENGGYGTDSIAQGLVSSTAIYVLVVSSLVALTTLACCAAIVVKPLARRLAACGVVMGMVVLPISLAFLQGADVPTGIYNCPMQAGVRQGAGADVCNDDVAYYSGLSSSATLLDTLAIVIGVTNLYLSWKQPQAGRRVRKAN